MLEKSKIEEVFIDQFSQFKNKNSGMERMVNIKKYLATEQVVVISGIRRCGKSTLLKQFADHLNNFYYINFDDERLINFTVDNFNDLLAVWQKNFKSTNILIDEIQNIKSWERFIRRIHDEGYKIFITGSNSKLLSSELSTHLTGRYKKLELYPFSFVEFIKFKNIPAQAKTTEEKAVLSKFFSEYLSRGGFPEYIKNKDTETVKRIYEDVIYKDIIARFGIREIKSFRLLANWLFTNFTKEASYNSLAKILGIKTAATVSEYVSFLQEAYLLFELYKYDYSLKKQYTSNKKIYVIDNGLRNEIAFSVSEDRGRLLENIVFIELKRRGQEAYFFRGKKECDFILLEKNKIKQALQVSLDFNGNNKKREMDGLLEAMIKFDLPSGVILTEDQEEEIKISGKKIKIQPVYRWLVEN
ncbi:MAG: ATP-binding protein [Patescibacteria group bacterium]|jgi:hypothetical protein